MIQAKCDRYTTLLLEAIARLRSVQNLEDIWHQTSEILGSALDISHGLILDRPSFAESCTVVAEYHQPSCYRSMSLLGQKVSIMEDADSRKALRYLRPVLIDPLNSDRPFSAKSLLIVATSYNQQANGLIHLYTYRRWTESELEFVQELAEQVGYYVAHLSAQQELYDSREKLAQTSSAIEKFLQNINDKLRNPLNGIIGSLNLILDDVLEDRAEQRDFLQEAHHSSIKLLHIINDLLHFSSLGSDRKARGMNQPVHLTKVLQEVKQLTQPRADYQQLYLDIMTPPNGEDLIVLGDESRLVQVFLNIVGNAIKFTHSGGVTISCEAIAQKIRDNDCEHPGWIKIQISDTGIGVSTEYIPRVFDPFFQVHDPRTSPYPGTGLGLSIAKKLIEIMGGDIQFFSMGEGLGSSIIFFLQGY